jgi:hypothetical protein
LSFEGLTETDEDLLEAATLHYYTYPQAEGSSCQIDRFECYPLKKNSDESVIMNGAL